MSLGDDKVPVVCPQCDKRLLVPAGTLGKQGRCPACKNVFTLEQLFEAETAVPVSGYNAGFANNDPFGAAAPAAKSPFADDDFTGDYQLQSAPQAPKPAVTQADFQQMASNYSGNYAPRSREEGTFWNGSVLGGLALIVIGAVWLFGGLAFGLLFWYAPILCVIGIYRVFKGLMNGNLAGE